MRSGDENGAPGLGDAVEFFHGRDDVGDVFDDVFGAELVERIIAEGQAAVVEMAEDIGGGGWIHIEADRAGIFCWTAANVENARQSSSCRRFFGQFSVSRRCKSCSRKKQIPLYVPRPSCSRGAGKKKRGTPVGVTRALRFRQSVRRLLAHSI